MKLLNYDSVYFLGIGGIGMSALARWFNYHGYKVAGYDKVRTQLCIKLEEEGMDIHYDDNPAKLPEDRSQSNTLIVYTPAIPKNHSEKSQLLKEGFELKKRSEVLGLISRTFYTVAVAGTHGKTTTSCLITHLINTAGKDVTAFLGGISSDLNSNFIANKTKEATAVVEADEFDRSFLTLHPNLAIITNTDADHLDIYGDHQHLLDSFRAFAEKVDPKGMLFINEKYAAELEVNNSNIRTYGINRGQFFASNISIRDGYFYFDFQGEDAKIHELKMGVPGFHNVENAVAAIAVALALNISEDKIREGLTSFKGVKRRFEFLVRDEEQVFIDDYAHHPTEIEAFLNSVKAIYPGRHLTVIFQPHLYSRTRDFASGFSKSLSLADRVMLLDIYPAREEPIPGVTSDIIFKGIDTDKVKCTKEGLLDILKSLETEIITTIGAGDIDTLVPVIKNWINKEEV